MLKLVKPIRDFRGVEFYTEDDDVFVRIFRK